MHSPTAVCGTGSWHRGEPDFEQEVNTDERSMTIDLNCDMGELADGALEEALMAHITSANVACGGHAGDAATMRRTVEMARRFGVSVGAHPGYPDRANF